MSAGGSEGDIRVAVEAAGTDEAIESIDETEESLNEAGESMGDTADEMQGLTRRMQGLGMALAASLAVATAGLLSQVPILGQAMGGLRAIVQGLAFQLDQLLRAMGVGGLTSAMYELSAALYELDGAAGAAVGAATGLVGVLAPASAILFKTGYAIAGVVTGATALAGAVGALLGVLGVLALDELGVLDWFHNLGEDTRVLYDTHMPAVKSAVNDVVGTFSDLVGLATGGVSGAFGWVTTALTDPKAAADDLYGVITDIGDWATQPVSGAFNWVDSQAGDALDAVRNGFDGLIDGAADWGSDLIDEFVSGIKGSIDSVRDAIDDVASTVSKYMPDSPAETGPLSDLDKSGPGMVETFASGIEANVGRAGEAASGLAGAADEGTEGGGFTADRGPTNVDVSMDGRRLTQQDSRYRRNGTAQRGRNG